MERPNLGRERMTKDQAKAALDRANERVAASQVALDAARDEGNAAIDEQRAAQAEFEAAT